MYNAVYYDYKEELIYISDDKQGILRKSNTPYVYRLTDKITNYKTMFGQYAEKTLYNDDINKFYEVDIRPEQRYLLDNYKNEDNIAKNVICFYDIEVDSRNGYAKKDRYDKMITCISTSINDEYVIFFCDDIKRKIEIKNNKFKFLYYRDEKKMLEDFFEYIFQKEVTILTAYNGDGFDLPYIINRSKRIRADYNKLSPIEKVFISKHGYIKIGLVNHMDYMLVYKNPIFRNKLPSYALDYVGNHELKIGKVKHQGLDKLYVKDIEQFLEYAYRDVWIMVEIEKKKGYLEKAIAICSYSLISYEDFHKSSAIIEGAILKYMKQNNIVSINNHNRENPKEEKIGAYVLEPIPKIYYDIIDLDYVSMYPSTILELNISPETKVAKVLNFEKHIDSWYDGKNAEIELSNYEKVIDYTLFELRDWLKENNYLIACNGVIYDNNYMGIIPSILKIWYEDKKNFSKLVEKYGNEGNKTLSALFALKTYISKILLNSSYGTLGLETFRFYDKEMAESTTISSQYLLKYSAKSTSEYINQKYNDNKNRLIYAHTDSLFYTLDGLANNNEEILTICSDIQQYINSDIKNWMNKMYNKDKNEYMEMKQEIIAKTGIFLVINRNALWVTWEKGVVKDDIQIKGISIVSTSFPTAFKTVLKEVIDIILKESDKKDNNKLKSKIDNIIFDFKNNMKNNNIYDLGITKGVNDIEKWQINTKWSKGTPIQVSSAINYNNLLHHLNLSNKYKNIESGDKMKYVYLNNNKYGFNSIGFFDDISKQIEDFIQEHINYDKIFNAEILNKIESIYEAIGWKLTDFNCQTNDTLF